MDGGKSEERRSEYAICIGKITGVQLARWRCARARLRADLLPNNPLTGEEYSKIGNGEMDEAGDDELLGHIQPGVSW